MTSTIARALQRRRFAAGDRGAAIPALVRAQEAQPVEPIQRGDPHERRTRLCDDEHRLLRVRPAVGTVELIPLEGGAGAGGRGRVAVVDPRAGRAQSGLHSECCGRADGEPAQRASRVRGRGQREQERGRDQSHQHDAVECRHRALCVRRARHEDRYQGADRKHPSRREHRPTRARSTRTPAARSTAGTAAAPPLAPNDRHRGRARASRRGRPSPPESLCASWPHSPGAQRVRGDPEREHRERERADRRAGRGAAGSRGRAARRPPLAASRPQPSVTNAATRSTRPVGGEAIKLAYLDGDERGKAEENEELEAELLASLRRSRSRRRPPVPAVATLMRRASRVPRGGLHRAARHAEQRPASGVGYRRDGAADARRRPGPAAGAPAPARCGAARVPAPSSGAAPGSTSASSACSRGHPASPGRGSRRGAGPGEHHRAATRPRQGEAQRRCRPDRDVERVSARGAARVERERHRHAARVLAEAAFDGDAGPRDGQPVDARSRRARAVGRSPSRLESRRRAWVCLSGNARIRSRSCGRTATHAGEHEHLAPCAHAFAHADLERVGPARAGRTDAHAPAAKGADAMRRPNGCASREGRGCRRGAPRSHPRQLRRSRPTTRARTVSSSPSSTRSAARLRARSRAPARRPRPRRRRRARRARASTPGT